ncbi:MAG: hypothetical protein WBQ73_03780, partial [Candidatus Babeliales bacterium]
PEEKLVRAIFGEKSREVRDTSLRVPPGVEGTVVDVKIFSRSGVRRDKRYKQEVDKQIELTERDFSAHIELLKELIAEKVLSLLSTEHTIKSLAPKSLDELFFVKVKNKELVEKIKELRKTYDNELRILVELKKERINKLRRGDVLPSGVIKIVKIYIAMKRTVSVGDKLAGRHGNKGVVSIIVPREDMPCLEDGTPVHIVLNPLGIPSRMNIGQILEAVLGIVGQKIGAKLSETVNKQSYEAIKKDCEKYYSTELIESIEKAEGKEGVIKLAHKTAREGVHYKVPVFDGARYEQDIKPLLQDLAIPEGAVFRLRDGKTGEYFDQDVMVGFCYIMKLNHMVEDKLHARSVGPYSLVTQQPLGGKAQMGGQRLGEMEVWALEGHNAAFILQEMLTYKSDDVSGRHRVYEAIVRNESMPEPGIPESFNVLIKELQSLALQVDLFKVGKEKISE